MSQPGWSEDRITTLKSLWLDGLSASQVATQLGGVTRNAVIGKIHRLGLSGRAQPSKPARLARPSKVRLSQCPAGPRATPAGRQSPLPSRPEPLPEGPGLASSVTMLGAHVCKWPIGDPKADGFTFCGRLAHGPYCPTHKAQAFRPGTAWRADRDPVIRLALAGRV
jgi:GcrA cell cycle regulator